MSTHFEVFKIFTFPFELFNGTYARLQLDRPYFAINLAQQAHLWLTDADIKKCSGGQGIRACPADVPVLSNELPTCPLSLYLQLGQANNLCNHELLRTVPPTRLFRHGALVLYHTLGPRRTFLRCRNDSRWVSSALMLNGSGLIEGASGCHISADGVHLRPVLRAETRFEGPTAQLFIPQLPSLHEQPALGAVQQLVQTPFFRMLSGDTRSPIPWTALSETVAQLGHSTPTPWYVTVLTAAATSLAVCVLYHLCGRYAPKLAQQWRGVSSPSSPGMASSHLDPSQEPQCSKDIVLESGDCVPLPNARYVRYPKTCGGDLETGTS
jgi:hypothetical protein